MITRIAIPALPALLLLISLQLSAQSATIDEKQIVDAVQRIEEQNMKTILEAEAEIEQARAAESKGDFENAAARAAKAKTMVGGLRGAYAKYKLQTINDYITSLNIKYAAAEFSNARKAYLDGNYTFAINSASKAARLDNSLKDQVDSFTKMCEKRVRAQSLQKASDINTLDPQHENKIDSIQVMLKEADVLIKNRMYDKARDVLEKILIKDPYNLTAISKLNDVYVRMTKVGEQRTRTDLIEGMEQLTFQWSEAVMPGEAVTPPDKPIVKSSEQSTLYEKLQKIIFENLEFDDASITSVISHLNTLSKQADPDGAGVSIVSNLSNTETAEIPRITMSFDQIPMSEAIRYICLNSGLKYKIEDKAIIIGDKSIDSMETRFFKVRVQLISSISGGTIGGDAEKKEDSFTDKDKTMDLEETFKKSDKKTTASASSPASASSDILKQYFVDRGIPFDEGATIAYDRRAGKLIVKNTYDNLRKLDHLLRDLDIQTPLVLIEAKIMEMSQTDLEELGFDWVFSSPGSTDVHPHWSIAENSQLLRHYSPSNSNSTSSGTSSDRAYRVLNDFKILPNFGGSDSEFNLSLTINAIDQHSKGEVLSAPKVIATSGTTALIRMVEQIYYPESWEDPELNVSNGSISLTPPTPEFGDAIDIGIRFEVTPSVSPNN